MERKTRQVWLISRTKLQEAKITKQMAGKEFECSYCGKNFVAKNISQTIYMEKDGYFLCYDCPFKKLTERQRYGFWLRFASEHFIPCDKCQDTIHKLMIEGKPIFHDKRELITLYRQESKKAWLVSFGFMEFQPIFEFCDECSKKLTEIWNLNELHLGNDVKPLVEFWRDWAIEDE